MADSKMILKTKIASNQNTSQITNANANGIGCRVRVALKKQRAISSLRLYVRFDGYSAWHGSGLIQSDAHQSPKEEKQLYRYHQTRGLAEVNASILKPLRVEYNTIQMGKRRIICIAGMGAGISRSVQPIYESMWLVDQPSFDEVRKIISKRLRCTQTNFLMNCTSAITIMP